MREVRRILLAAAIAAMTVLVIGPAPAGAKGFGHEVLTVQVAGLSGHLQLRGEDIWPFVSAMGLGDRKWDAPNVAGDLRKDLPLGAGYFATGISRCDRAEASTFGMTIFPRAEGGPQLRVDPGGSLCDGSRVEPGWWPLRTDTLRPFFKMGMPRPLSDEAPAPGDAAPPAPGPSSGIGVGWIVGAILTVALLVAIAIRTALRRNALRGRVGP